MRIPGLSKPPRARAANPVVIFQSDDWGRVGVRDREGWEELRAAGILLGQKPYDYYSLETADDLAAIRAILKNHRDSTGRPPCLVMNFCVANLDFPRIHDSNFQSLSLQPLSQGVPGKWRRPGLLDEYREGIAEGVFYPGLHGTTHFCRSAVEERVPQHSSEGALLRSLLRAETPYIHWRMPWVGFEYWRRDSRNEFLSAGEQRRLIVDAVRGFVELFGTAPLTACAPGYRANEDTRRVWSGCGIRVAQNGPGGLLPPHIDESGLLNTYRTVEFEPALYPDRYTAGSCMERAARCFARGIPAIVSVHSINFHSTLKDFRQPTLQLLDGFLTALEREYPDLLYFHDVDLYRSITGLDSRGANPDLAIEPVSSTASRAL